MWDVFRLPHTFILHVLQRSFHPSEAVERDQFIQLQGDQQNTAEFRTSLMLTTEQGDIVEKGKITSTVKAWLLTSCLFFLDMEKYSSSIFSCDMTSSLLQKWAPQVSEMVDAVRAVLKRKD